MKIIYFWRLIIVVLFTIAGCKDPKPDRATKKTGIDTEDINNPKTETKAQPPAEVETPIKMLDQLADTSFVRIADYSKDFVYDLRYATENNFLKVKVYECPECYTRVKTVKALLEANEDFIKQGFKIKFFDCYRPNSVQYKMWAVVPNPQYVANPVKGSIHNKGGAVDITLVTLDDIYVDMGTDFDYFGKRAYHDNTELPQTILDNRRILKETMEKYGFWSIRSEWWHYNLSAASNDKIANFKWECN